MPRPASTIASACTAATTMAVAMLDCAPRRYETDREA
jgi:hypothetical protein